MEQNKACGDPDLAKQRRAMITDNKLPVRMPQNEGRYDTNNVVNKSRLEQMDVITRWLQGYVLTDMDIELLNNSNQLQKWVQIFNHRKLDKGSAGELNYFKAVKNKILEKDPRGVFQKRNKRQLEREIAANPGELLKNKDAEDDLKQLVKKYNLKDTANNSKYSQYTYYPGSHYIHQTKITKKSSDEQKKKRGGKRGTRESSNDVEGFTFESAISTLKNYAACTMFPEGHSLAVQGEPVFMLDTRIDQSCAKPVEEAINETRISMKRTVIATSVSGVIDAFEQFKKKNEGELIHKDVCIRLGTSKLSE